MVSVRIAVWVGLPVFLALNLFLLWRGTSPRLNWVTAVCADRVYVRLFTRRGRNRGDVDDPEIMVLQASEIASMSAKTIEVFLYGSKPKILEWLVIEPAQNIEEDVSERIRPLQCGTSPNLCSIDPSKRVFVGNGEGPLTIEWKYCRPALRSFLERVAQQCPSILIAPEQRSELDLNGIWHGFRSKPNAEQRRLLAQAIRLGFGRKCVQLLAVYRSMPLRQARAYLAELEQGEASSGN
jgi:hypothetical protein